MKKLFILLFPVLLFSCATQKSFTNSDTNTNLNQGKETEKIYETIFRDSLVIRDSVVLHADGSVSKIHSENKTKIQIENVYWYINQHIELTKTVLRTEKIYYTKYKHDFIWYSGLLFYLSVIIFLIYKLKNKLKP